MVKSQYRPLVDVDECEKAETYSNVWTKRICQLHEIHDGGSFVSFSSLSFVVCYFLLLLIFFRTPYAVFVQWIEIHWVWFRHTFRFAETKNWHSVALTTAPTTTRATHTHTHVKSQRRSPAQENKRTTRKAHERANGIVWLTIFYLSLTLLLLLWLLVFFFICSSLF